MFFYFTSEIFVSKMSMSCLVMHMPKISGLAQSFFRRFIFCVKIKFQEIKEGVIL